MALPLPLRSRVLSLPRVRPPGPMPELEDCPPFVLDPVSVIGSCGGWGLRDLGPSPPLGSVTVTFLLSVPCRRGRGCLQKEPLG